MLADMRTFTFFGMTIPEHMHGPVRDYIEHGAPPGNFLEAILENNLTEAVGRADTENMRNIPALVAYLYNEAPAPCWGSPENVGAWLRMKAEEREFWCQDVADLLEEAHEKNGP